MRDLIIGFGSVLFLLFLMSDAVLDEILYWLRRREARRVTK